MNSLSHYVAGWMFWAAVASLASAGEPELRVATGADKRPIAVEGISLPDETVAELRRLDADHSAWPEILRVFVVSDEGQVQLPALAGRVELVGNTVRFTPQFSLRPGTTYRATLATNALSSRASTLNLAKDFTIPSAPPSRPTEVTAVYPSEEKLPENQLRFYLHFSAPMAAGDAYDHVKLIRADGKVVSKAFLELPQELWDGSNQRFTLLFDPGRVKQGLQPRQEFGPVLEPGQSYRLVVDKSWRDANGQALAAGFEKRFTAGAAVETAVDYRQWKISPPIAGARDPLRIVFDRPLDRALMQRMITVADGKQATVDGDITIGDNERRWEFRPDQQWTAGAHTLVVDTTLEDSAGNNLARPFEVDVFERIDAKSGPDYVRIPFAISAR